MIDVREAIARAHQEEWARVVALTRRFDDIDIAEGAAAGAFATAVERSTGQRRTCRPSACVATTARHKAPSTAFRRGRAARDEQKKDYGCLTTTTHLSPYQRHRRRARSELIFTCWPPALAIRLA